MKPLGLISQIAAIGLAIAIVVFFVLPNFTTVGEVQNEIEQYAQERERVTETNANLAALVSELEAVSVIDRTRLATYIPNLLDEVAVLRDLEIITEIAGVRYNDIQYVGETVADGQQATISNELQTEVAHDFQISVEGTYNQIKDFFSLLEQNHYPLQTSALDMTVREGGFLQADATIVTYVTNSSAIATR